jgi:hypothetical protein
MRHAQLIVGDEYVTLIQREGVAIGDNLTRSMANLSLQFYRWRRVRNGYRLVQPKDSSSPRIFANEGPWISYYPFANADNLYALFAKVGDTKQLLDFIGNFGPLTSRGFETAPRRQEPVPNIIDLSAVPVEPDDKYGRDFRVADYVGDLFYRAEFGGEEVEKDLEEASFFRRCLENSNSPQRIRSIIAENRYIFILRAVPGDGRKTGLDIQVDPGDLLQALRFQLFLKLTGNANLRSCRHCGQWFEVGPGTGRRLDAKFCTDKHRIFANSAKRTKQVTRGR